MATETDCQLRVVMNGKEAKGSTHIRRITQRDAVLRGLKTSGLTVLAAFCTIIIPGVHFLSVPGGLLAVPIVGVMIFLKSRGGIHGMSGFFSCPICGKTNIMEYQEGKPPYFGSCTSCKDPYQVFPA